MISIQYRAGYKYQLACGFLVQTSIRGFAGGNEWVGITREGRLSIREGYAWDGPSGPAIDTRNFMRASLIHDALYQLIREGVILQSARRAADELLRATCLEDGMSRIRAWWVYHAVRWKGGPSADPSNERPVLTAP